MPKQTPLEVFGLDDSITYPLPQAHRAAVGSCVPVTVPDT